MTHPKRVKDVGVRVVEIGLGEQVHFKTPPGYMICLVWLGGNTYAAKLHDIT